MNVQIRYFAAAREAVGREHETVQLAEGSTVAALLETLCERHPDLRAPAADLRVALDERFARGEDALHEGAVVALIPPVGGG
ncbi:MAG: molybdopterin converting factor subunit 1 [Planctomycetota bacterium]|nr:molybdopterin converting factor subunit 1 [Planctomycetota bacterium]